MGIDDFGEPKSQRNIEITYEWNHLKASESYVSVIFRYPDHGVIWNGAVPTEYRRGPNIKVESPRDLWKLLMNVYQYMHPDNEIHWMKKQEDYWGGKKDGPTKDLFNGVSHCEWICATCALPENPNWARRWQDLKEAGYTTATIPSHDCEICDGKRAKIIMLRFPREVETGYETIPPKVRKRIMDVLGNYDVYGDVVRTKGLLPDHKFPEIRWDPDTRGINTELMTEEEIQDKFQLMDNQRNQQKREACRQCKQTGKRGFTFGVKFYYCGDENWDSNIPTEGKDAEVGCVGCAWYDLDEWRIALNQKLGYSID